MTDTPLRNDIIRVRLKKKLKRYGYALFLLPPFLPFAGYALAAHVGFPNLFAFTTVIFFYAVIPVLDLLIGKDPQNADNMEAQEMSGELYYRALLWLNVPVALLSLTGGIWLSVHWQTLNLWGYLGLALSFGTISTSIMINAAHELIHKSSRFERNLGGVLLCLTCYPGFKIEHLYGHHVHVATPKDQSTSCYGQSLYQFLPAVLARNFRIAWRLHCSQLQKRGLRIWSVHNELLRWYALVALIMASVTAAFGLWGLGFFIVQSLLAITLLETVNYLEHYGLQRRRNANGRYERTTHEHSWNSNYLLTNLMTFQLQRHSDHHAHPQRRYQVLRHFDDSPQLPAGYATMIMIAMIPPLWMKIMNPRVRRYYNRMDNKRVNS